MENEADHAGEPVRFDGERVVISSSDDDNAGEELLGVGVMDVAMVDVCAPI